MLKDALSILTAEKRYTIQERERLESLLCSSKRISQRTEEEQLLWETLHGTVEGEFTSLVRASIIKSILGKNYIHTIRHQLYRYCDKDKMRDTFFEYYSYGKGTKESDPPLNSLYQLAKFILLYEPLVAIVTYNYDKFLTMAAEILYENREQFFSTKEKEILANNKRWRNGVQIEEVYGNFNNSQQADNILPIYHIHGYLPPFNEPFLSDGNEIVLSMEEYYDNVRNVYSWQTATQLHFLCHFTSLFVGNSLSDINPQRMVHYASSIGNEEKIYFLHASTKNYLKGTQPDDYKSYVQIMEIKDAFFTNYGLQLGEEIPVVTEPERRDTFPAIALASSYLAYERKCSTDEIVIIMPCDPYTEAGYFDTIRRIADAVKNNVAELVLMGVKPTYPSAKYGYVVPANDVQNKGTFQVSRFTEKPDMMTAEKLISEGAFWNGGVFAFRLGYMTDIVARYIEADTFAEIRSRYGEFPKISFDYEVAEKAQSVAVAPFAGEWKDLGTWNTLTDELSEHTVGNVVMDDESENTHVINELELPIMCIGARNLVIAASNDGILISDKSKSENIKTYADCLQRRPMFEERRWGEYKVVNTAEFPDGCKSLTKQLKINAGKSISYQMHRHRDEVWTFIDGEGELLLDGVRSVVGRGDTVMIRKGAKHAVKAISDLTFIEVQSGDLLVEEDIERFDWDW